MWQINLHTIFSQVPDSHHDFPNPLSSLNILPTILSISENAKLGYPSPIMSWHHDELTMSAEYTQGQLSPASSQCFFFYLSSLSACYDLLLSKYIG